MVTGGMSGHRGDHEWLQGGTGVATGGTRSGHRGDQEWPQGGPGVATGGPGMATGGPLYYSMIKGTDLLVLSKSETRCQG